MKVNRILVAVALLGVLAGPGLSWSQEQPKPPSYTRAEYDAFEAARLETNPQQRILKLDDFLAKYPASELLPFALQLYYPTYQQLRNYPKTIEYADKLLALGDKIDAGSQFQALYTRAVVFEFALNLRDPNAPQALRGAVEAAKKGLEVLPKVPKPEQATQEQFDQGRKVATLQFLLTGGFASLQLKDYPGAIEGYSKALELDPNPPLSWYRLGIAHMQSEPQQFEAGAWAMARALALKFPDDRLQTQVRNYLRAQLLKYQGTACDNLIDPQLNELVQLATASTQRPEGYHIPTSAEIARSREDAAGFLKNLQTGGEQAKVTWLAMCGLEFPEVAGKVIEVADGNDSVQLKLFLGATPEETEAGQTANMELKVVGQPAARLLKKDDAVRFSATLAKFTPDPFTVGWENAKINPEDLPEDKPQPPKKAPAKRPAKRPPAKGV